MNSPTPIISIIIPTLKEEEFLERTLKNFQQFSLPHEIIVADGGSKDRTLEIARRYTDKVVVWEKSRRQTFGEAKNAGAAIALGEYLVFIDADVTVPEPDAFFKKTISEFEKDPSLVAMTVSLMPWIENHSLKDSLFSMPLNIWYIISNNVFHYGNASGEFQMIRKSAFTATKGYREDLGGGEDTDMFNRLSKMGRTHSHWQLYVRHSCRRAHKTGWLKIYWMWMRQGFSVLLLRRNAYKEWPVIR
ncbi:glycosyltransferase [Candidatus Parcubacteria bacterium]|nr:glycosyltransferase [Candidatus Parcubacteria bacterium]